jgi:hypothetical protein
MFRIFLFQGCRANLKQDPQVCKAMRENQEFGIVCNTYAAVDGDEVEAKTEITAETSSLDLTMRNYTINGTVIDFSDFQDMVCDAQTKIFAMTADNTWLRTYVGE